LLRTCSKMMFTMQKFRPVNWGQVSFENWPAGVFIFL
jgi:hypothetical protein